LVHASAGVCVSTSMVLDSTAALALWLVSNARTAKKLRVSTAANSALLTGAWLHGHVFIKDLDRTAVGILSPGANAIDSPKRLSPSLRHDERSVASRPTAGGVDSGAELSIRDISACTLPLTALPRLTRADAGVVRVGRRRPDR